MTEKLYYQDAYATAFTARVLACTRAEDAYCVILDRTLFYPEGGGQPADTGRLGDAAVLDVHERDGRILHTTDKPLEIGAEVAGEIDWARRFDLMQNHSGEHILSGVICARYGCDNVGFHMGRESITIDLNTKIPPEDLPQLEEKANEAIWQNVPVGVRYPAREELQEMTYRSKKELEGQVRIVNIGAYDCCACCGTHVRFAGEIGLIQIIGAQNYKGGTRLELLCGKRALQDYRQKNESIGEIGRSLSVPPQKAELAVKNLLAERDELLQALHQLKWEFFHQNAAKLADGTENIVFFADGLEHKDLTHFADLLLKKGAVRAAVFTSAGEGLAFVLLSRAGDARAIVEEMQTRFSCKGGGKKDAAQGRVAAQRQALEAFFADQGFTIER